jgi:hypothetical protein
MHCRGACAIVNPQRVLKILLLVLLCGPLLYWSHRTYFPDPQQQRKSLLALLPPEASWVFFVDLADLGRSGFLANLYSLAPQPQTDPDYAAFIKQSGFNYERDLYRLAVSYQRKGQDYFFSRSRTESSTRKKLPSTHRKTGSVR